MRPKGRAISTLIALTACAVLHSGCIRGSSVAEGGTGNAKPLPTEADIKERLLLAAPATTAEPLKLERQIISKPAEGGALVLPVSVAFSAEGGIYISDNTRHAIHYCPSDSDTLSTLPPQSGVGNIRAPTTIHLRQDAIFVSDRDGIKVIKRDGSFERLLRVYYGIFHFAIAPDGAIYVNPFFARADASNPLIVKLDGKGTRVSRFGARVDSPSHDGLDDRAFLFATSDLLIAAFACRPAIQIYDRSKEELVREFRVEHPIFGTLEPLGDDPKYLHPRPGVTALPRFVAGMSFAGGNIFVLLHLPKPEIVAFDLEGKERGRYRLDGLPAAINYFGFDVRRVGDKYRFTVGVIDAGSVPTLAEYTLAAVR
jgi:hypothetical protein